MGRFWFAVLFWCVALPLAAAPLVVPDDLQKRLRTAPERYLADAAGLIHGFGGADGVDAAGIEQFIALERAEARARVLERALWADLNNDGDVTMPEAAVLLPALAARQRGDFALMLHRADGNGDGTASAVELRADAALQAEKSLSDADAADLRALLTLDMDGNGRVTLDEVSAMAAQFAAETPEMDGS